MKKSILLLLFLNSYNTMFPSFSLFWDYIRYRISLVFIAQKASKLPGDFDTVEVQALDGKKVRLSKNDAERLAHFPPPYELYKYIRTHDKIRTLQPLENKWLMKCPDSWRPIGVEKMNNVFQKHGIKYFRVPRKHLFLVNSEVDLFGEGAPAVFADYVKPKQKDKFNLEQVKEFETVLKYTGYKDFQDPNNLTQVDNVYYFIDTEAASFYRGGRTIDGITIINKNAIKLVARYRNHMTPEAREYVLNRPKEANPKLYEEVLEYDQAHQGQDV